MQTDGYLHSYIPCTEAGAHTHCCGGESPRSTVSKLDDGRQICTRCHLFVDNTGKPDPQVYDAAFFNWYDSISPEIRCAHLRSSTVIAQKQKMEPQRISPQGLTGE